MIVLIILLFGLSGNANSNSFLFTDPCFINRNHGLPNTRFNQLEHVTLLFGLLYALVKLVKSVKVAKVLNFKKITLCSSSKQAPSSQVPFCRFLCHYKSIAALPAF